MFTMDTQNNESGLLTTTRPGPNPFQPDNELSNFLRDLALRRRGPAGPPPARRGLGANANVGAPSRMTNAHDNTGAQMQALALREKQGELRDADAIRNLRPSPTMLTPQMGGGVIYGYDQQALSPIQRKAVNPENAQIVNNPNTPSPASLSESTIGPPVIGKDGGPSLDDRLLAAGADRSNREILDRGNEEQRQQDERLRALYGLLFGGR